MRVAHRAIHAIIATLTLLATAHADEPRAPGDARPEVHWNANEARIELRGLPPELCSAIARADLDRNQWNAVLKVAVASGGAATSMAMLGRSLVEEDVIAFVPRFPLRPGLTYRVVFDPGALPGGLGAGHQSVDQTIVLPDKPNVIAASVEEVYPTSPEVPENLLKFYVHFSAPMSRGESYQHVRILDADGRDVPDAILEIGEELWDADQRRLTLLFDPGRIKRGLKPHDDVGLPLVAGRQYTLVIDPEWRDARGGALSSGWQREFRVTEPDVVQPDPRRWNVSPPKAGTRRPLVVALDEPLDRALLEHMISVHSAAGVPIDGRVIVDRQETRWSFLPEAPWQAGRYELRIDPALEDRAGNSVGRPFEVLDGASNVAAPPSRPIVLDFEVAATAE